MFGRNRRPLLVVTVTLSVAWGVAACGGGESSTERSAPDGTAAPIPTTGAAPETTAQGQPATTTTHPEPDVPAVDVVVLATGSTVGLRSLASPGRPTLLWFWAPHCSFCRREAPELLEFAAEHGADVDIVGVGAQDSLDEAHGFLEETGTAGLTMVWDPSGQSWVHYGVTNQPTVIVLGGNGQVAGTWFRDFGPDEILAAAGVA